MRKQSKHKPFESGTRREVMVAPQLLTLTVIMPLVSSKISAINGWIVVQNPSLDLDEQEALFLSVSSKNKLEHWSDETNFVRIDNKRVPRLSVIWCIAIVLFCEDDERDRTDGVTDGMPWARRLNWIGTYSLSYP